MWLQVVLPLEVVGNVAKTVVVSGVSIVVEAAEEARRRTGTAVSAIIAEEEAEGAGGADGAAAAGGSEGAAGTQQAAKESEGKGRRLRMRKKVDVDLLRTLIFLCNDPASGKIIMGNLSLAMACSCAGPSWLPQPPVL